uniref:Uncharacterized protein n=1 Tax=Knipowitschia caucasica TaxID=637954 RepID=A0AAV2KQS3_KNICA
MEMGFKTSSQVKLVGGAVPSLHAACLSANGANVASPANQRRSTSAADKRWLSTILRDNNPAVSEAASGPHTAPDQEQEAHTSFDPLPHTVDRILQCNVTPSHQSSAVQVQPKMTSVGTQTEDYNPLTSTPLKRILDDTDDQSSDFNQQCDSSWCIEDDEDIESEMSEMEDSQEAQQEDDRELQVPQIPQRRLGNPSDQGESFIRLCCSSHGVPPTNLQQVSI